MKRPLIGISCNTNLRTLSGNNERWFHDINDTYVKAVEESGGIPLIIPNGLNEEDIDALAGKLDGFLFSGGGDVDPERYGESRQMAYGINEDRDDTEIRLLLKVLHDSDKPVFCICRGLQMLNVALGGTLIVDLESAGKNRHSLTECKREEFSHEVDIVKGSRLDGIMQGEDRVNSFHHQAIDVPAEGLAISARSRKDKVIEAVEMTGERFILAVQWHPEELTANKAHRALFERFIQAAEHAGAYIAESQNGL